MKKFDHFTEDLKAAVDKLEAFTELTHASRDISKQKIVDMMGAFFSATFSEKKRELHDKQREQNHVELLHAIDVLKSSYLLIEKLQKGTPQQQKLASSALGAIERYNAIIDKAKCKPSSLSERIAFFLVEMTAPLRVESLAKIHLPLQKTIQLNYFDKAQGENGSQKHHSSKTLTPYMMASTQKISYLTQLIVPVAPLPLHQVPHLSKQALEMFYMKVIAMVEKNGILTNSEARQAVKKAHLQFTLNSDLQSCHVSCTLSPFPGQTIVAQGSFLKDPLASYYTLPDATSFHLAFTSTQTGFPHPLQHNGWALPDLIPLFPYKLDELPLFKPIYEQKQRLSQAMLPNDQLVEKAKEVIQQKRQAFDQNKDLFLGLHQELMQAFVGGKESGYGSQEIGEKVVEAFFQRLQPVHHAYEYLAETHHLIHVLYYMRPYERLQNAWMERRLHDFTLPDLQKRYRACLDFLEKEGLQATEELMRQRQEAASELEKCTIDFMLCVGNALKAAAYPLLLQQLSESWSFAPPMLDDFSLKIQCLAFKQLKAFFKVLASDCVEEDKETLVRSLQSEIKLLKAHSYDDVEKVEADAQLPNELEGYYNARYYALS